MPVKSGPTSRVATVKRCPLPLLTFLILCSILLVNPSPAFGDGSSGKTGAVIQIPGCPLTPSQEYAGELLSYLLKVVLGREGNPRSRDEWKKIGTFERLDLRAINRKMTDSAENLSDVMVIDSNILDLSRVAYYYDHSLSFQKNRDSDSNIYPSSELLGIRLLLLNKLKKNEKINLSALVDREKEILLYKNLMTPADLQTMNLTQDEMELVSDIIHSEPHYFQYLKCPFLVSALHEVGAIRSDAFTRQKIAEANYQKFHYRPFGGSDRKDAVKIALLPSFTREFYPLQAIDSRSFPFGFQPTPFFLEMSNKLKNSILSRTKTLMYEEMQKRAGQPAPEGEAWEGLWKKILRERISFTIQDQRPLIIYPGNAQRILEGMHPRADFAVIILGKNVYLSMDIQEKDRFPAVNRLYIDIMDIRHAQIGEEVDQVSRYIVSRLRDFLMTQ